MPGRVRALVPHNVSRGIWLGLGIILAGLALDTYVHLFLGTAGGPVIAGFSVPEHFAHLVVLVGMLVMLGAIVASGIRGIESAPGTSSKGGPDALR